MISYRKDSKEDFPHKIYTFLKSKAAFGKLINVRFIQGVIYQKSNMLLLRIPASIKPQ